MAIAFRAASRGTTTSTNTLTVGEPTGTASGDVLIAIAESDGTTTFPTMPAGWTSLFTQAGVNVSYRVCYIVRGGSAANTTFTFAATSYNEVQICGFSGVNNTNPIDSQSASGTTGTTGSSGFDPPATTAATASTWAVCGGFNDSGSATGGWAAPTGYTIRSVNTVGDDGAIATKALTAGGSENPSAFTNSGTTTSSFWNGFTITLLPAGTSFGHVQANYNHSPGTALSSLAVTLGNPPTVGNLVVVGVYIQSGPGAGVITVKDANNNVYTKAAHSPSSANDGTAGTTWIYYWVATGTPSSTINLTLTNAQVTVSMGVDEFSVSGGTASLDTDAAGSGTAVTTTTTPTINLTGSGELVYLLVGPSGSVATIGGSFNWGGPGGGTGNYGEGFGYLLSGTGSQTPSTTFTAASDYDDVIAAFQITFGSSLPPMGWNLITNQPRFDKTIVIAT